LRGKPLERGIPIGSSGLFERAAELFLKAFFLEVDAGVFDVLPLRFRPVQLLR
jgi:hypothetical protein